jgi:hypothetical protein
MRLLWSIFREKSARFLWPTSKEKGQRKLLSMDLSYSFLNANMTYFGIVCSEPHHFKKQMLLILIKSNLWTTSFMNFTFYVLFKECFSFSELKKTLKFLLFSYFRFNFIIQFTIISVGYEQGKACDFSPI